MAQCNSLAKAVLLSNVHRRLVVIKRFVKGPYIIKGYSGEDLKSLRKHFEKLEISFDDSHNDARDIFRKERELPDREIVVVTWVKNNQVILYGIGESGPPVFHYSYFFERDPNIESAVDLLE